MNAYHSFKIMEKLCGLTLTEGGSYVAGSYGITPLAVDPSGDLRTLEVDANGRLLTTIDASTVTLEVNLDLVNDEVMTGVTNDGGTTRTLAVGGKTGAIATALGVANSLPTGQFLATEPTLTDTQLHNLLVDENGNLKVNGGVLQGLVTDHSINTLGSASTLLVPANNDRQYLEIQNTDTTNTIWINFGSSASAGYGSFRLSPSSSISYDGSGFVPTQAVYGYATGANTQVTIKEG